jgi:hypothetical protein
MPSPKKTTPRVKKISAALAAAAETAAKEMGPDDLALATVDDQVATGEIVVETTFSATTPIEQIETAFPGQSDAAQEAIDCGATTVEEVKSVIEPEGETAPESNETTFAGVDFAAALNATVKPETTEKKEKLVRLSVPLYETDENLISCGRVGQAIGPRWFQKKRMHSWSADPQGRVHDNGMPLVQSVTMPFSQAKERKILHLCDILD